MNSLTKSRPPHEVHRAVPFAFCPFSFLQLPEIVSRPAHPHPTSTQILAPFSTSPRPYLGGEICYAEIAAVTPTSSLADFVKPIPTTANRADQRKLLSKAVCSGQPSLLSKSDFSYPTGAHTAMSAPARGATLGTVEGEVVAATGVVNAHGEPTSWSLSPHREKRRPPLKPLHSSSATALVRSSSNPSLGLPPTSSSSSTFSHRLRRRLQGSLEEGEGRGGGSGQVRAARANATGPEAAAAAAAAIAAMVSSSSGADDALTRQTFLGRGVPLLEGSSSGSQPSGMHDQRGLKEGEPSSSHPTAGPDMSMTRSISWTPSSSSGGTSSSNSSAAHTAGASRAAAAPRLRRGSSLTYFTSQMDAPYRNDSERRPGGVHSPPLGKAPAGPSLRRASASPTLSPAIDRVRFPRRSPSLRGTSLDADQVDQSVYIENEPSTNILRSGSGDSDGALPPPLLGTAQQQPPTVMLRDAGRDGQEKGPGGVRVSGRATSAGLGGMALSARQAVLDGQSETGGDSVVGVSEASHAPVEKADTPKIFRRDSHFGGKSSVSQGSSSRQNGRCEGVRRRSVPESCLDVNT